MKYFIRKADLDDCAEIEKLIALSARKLSINDYSREQMEGALQGAFGVDTQLIRDGTYFVAESIQSIIGCGGWSRRKTLFGGDKRTERDPAELNPKLDSAKIRAFFIHPDYARMGISRAIYERCESEARLYGFQSLELISTIPGIKFYISCGFRGLKQIEYKMPSGVIINFLPMKKIL
jgi:N-acetylglutamate synthase-like GNAT family acetyltransferase